MSRAILSFGRKCADTGRVASQVPGGVDTQLINLLAVQSEYMPLLRQRNMRAVETHVEQPAVLVWQSQLAETKSRTITWFKKDSPNQTASIIFGLRSQSFRSPLQMVDIPSSWQWPGSRTLSPCSWSQKPRSFL